MVYPTENYVEKVDNLVFISPDKSDPKWTFEKPDKFAKIAVSKEGEGAQYVIMFSDKQLLIVPRKLEETSDIYDQHIQTIFKWIVSGLKQVAADRGLTADNINALNLEIVLYSPVQYTTAFTKKQVTDSFDAFGYGFSALATSVETHTSYGTVQCKGFTEYKIPIKLQANLANEPVIAGTDAFKCLTSYKFKCNTPGLIHGAQAGAFQHAAFQPGMFQPAAFQPAAFQPAAFQPQQPAFQPGAFGQGGMFGFNQK